MWGKGRTANEGGSWNSTETLFSSLTIEQKLNCVAERTKTHFRALMKIHHSWGKGIERKNSQPEGKQG